MRRIPALLAMLAACGKDTAPTPDDLLASEAVAGLYETSRMTENTSCGGRGEEVIPIPFLRLTESAGKVETFECRSETDCNTVATEDWEFLDDAGDWLGEGHGGNLSEQEGACYLWYQERTLEVADGEATLERREYTYYDLEITTAADCDEAWPDWKGRGGTCANETKIFATRIGN